MSDLVAVVIIVGLVCLLVLLSAAESALTSISRSRAEVLDDDVIEGASELVELLRDRSRGLGPVQLLALGAQLVIASLVAFIVERRWGASWITLAVAVQLVALFVFAETVPKTWAARNIDRAAPSAALAARWLNKIAPLRWVVRLLLAIAGRMLRRGAQRPAPIASEDEIVALADAAVAAAVIDEEEGEIIQSIVDFGDTLVRETMVPRPDVLAAMGDTKIDDAIAMLVDRGVSRMPIYGADIDDVRGIVHIKDLFAQVQRGRGGHFVATAQRPPYFVPETKRAAELLAELRVVHASMVVVVDEYGGMAGILTMEDLVEEIVGEIVDEFDPAEEPLLEPLRQGEWMVHGRMPVDEFNDLLGADLPDDDWDTVGGLMFDALGRVAEEGESVVEFGYRLTVEQVEGRRITRVRVVQATEDDDEEAAE